MKLETIFVFCIFISIYNLDHVLSGKCCQMTDLYIESAKLQKGQTKPADPCIKFEKINKCLGKENVGTCDWFCYLTKAKKQPTFKKPGKPKKKKDSEYVFGKDELKELSAINSASKYYSAYQLLTYDNTGKAELYNFSTTFVRNEKISELQAIFADFWSKTELTAISKIPPKSDGKPDLKKLHTTCAMEAHKHSNTIFSDKCREYMFSSQNSIKIKRRLSNANDTRRRLAVGAESTVTVNQAVLVNEPFSAVGVLYFEYNDGTDSEGRGTGTVIKSVKEGLKYYEYILTAGHNCYDNSGVDDKKLSWNIRFWKGLNRDVAGWDDTLTVDTAPTHAANMMKRVWVPLYTKVQSQANDFCVIKYQVAAVGDTSTKTDSSTRRRRMQLITYRFGDSGGIDIQNHPHRQRKRVNVRPEAGGGELYIIAPYYTRVGMSGSGLFIETSHGVLENIVCAVHVGNNGEAGGDKRSVHTMLNKEKIQIIDKIISNRWDAHADVSNARESYENIINYFPHSAHKEEIQNNYDNYYDDDIDQNVYERDNSYLYQVNHDVNDAVNSSLYTVLFILICIFGLICWSVALCCGVMIGFTLTNLWISNKEKHVYNSIQDDEQINNQI